jgi:hypothetical protein
MVHPLFATICRPAGRQVACITAMLPWSWGCLLQLYGCALLPFALIVDGVFDYLSVRSSNSIFSGLSQHRILCAHLSLATSVVCYLYARETGLCVCLHQLRRPGGPTECDSDLEPIPTFALVLLWVDSCALGVQLILQLVSRFMYSLTKIPLGWLLVIIAALQYRFR